MTDAARRPSTLGWVGRWLGVVLTLAVWVPVAAVAAAVTGVAGSRLGVLWVPLVLLVCLTAVWALLRPLRRRRVVVVVLGIALTCAGFWMGATAIPTLGRVVGAADGVEVPAGAELRSEDAMSNNLCFMGCSRVTRVYDVPDGPAARRYVENHLAAAGWSAAGENHYCRGAFGVQIGAPPPFDDEPPPPTLELTVTATCYGY